MSKGQSLIEVLVGLAIAVIIVGAITAATITALQNAQYSKNQNLATQYAQQGMEIVRNLRDRRYGCFAELSGDYCLAKTCDQINPNGNSQDSCNKTPLNNPDPCGQKSILCSQTVGGENADIFVRQISISPSSSQNLNCKEATGQTTYGTYVKVNVSWFDSKCGVSNVFCHTVSLSSCFSTFNAIGNQ